MTFAVRAPTGAQAVTVVVFGLARAVVLFDGVATIAVEVADEWGEVTIEARADRGTDGIPVSVVKAFEFRRAHDNRGLAMRLQVLSTLNRWVAGLPGGHAAADA